MTLSINKIDGCGLDNTAHHELQPRRLSYCVTTYVVTEEEPPVANSSDKTECFSYKHSDYFGLKQLSTSIKEVLLLRHWSSNEAILDFKNNLYALLYIS